MPSHASSRLRLTPLALATGLVGTVLLSLSLTGTLSTFTASIANATNTAGTGTLTMSETLTSSTNPNATTNAVCSSADVPDGVDANSATCTTINKFGGDMGMTPGGPASVVDIAITNTGSIAASKFALTPGTCTQANSGTTNNGSATDLCSKVSVLITSNGNRVFSGTAAQLSSSTVTDLNAPRITMPAAPAAGASVPFRFTVSVDGSAGNTYQGLSASLPLTWTFTG
jgi:hypothetical protein